MLLLSAFAADFGRQDEPLKTTRYARMQGEGPVYGQWRNRRGAHEAVCFPDGQVLFVDTYDGKTRTETRTYAADGRPEAVVDWAASTVTLATAPAQTVSFAEWAEVPIAGLVFRAPPLEAGEHTWTREGLAIALQPAADPFDADFATALRTGCGCEIEAKRTVWLGQRVGAHFRLQRPDATADVVAVPTADGLLVLTAAGPDLAALAPLRAMMATAREAP